MFTFDEIACMNCDAMWHNEMIQLSTLFILVRPAGLHASAIVYKQTNNDNRSLAKKNEEKQIGI